MKKNLNLVLKERESLKEWIHFLHQTDPHLSVSEEGTRAFLDSFLVDLMKKSLAINGLLSAFPDEFAKAVALESELEVTALAFRSEFLYAYRSAPKESRLLDPIVRYFVLANRVLLDEATPLPNRMQRTSSFDFATERLSFLLGVDKSRILATLS